MGRPKRDREAENREGWRVIETWKSAIRQRFSDQATTEELMDVAYRPAVPRKTG